MQEKLFIEKIKNHMVVENPAYSAGSALMSVAPDKFALHLLYLQLEGFVASWKSFKIDNNTQEVLLDRRELDNFLRYKAPQDEINLIKDALRRDDISLKTCVAYFWYKKAKQNAKNYIVSANLTKCLSNIKLDIPLSAMPKEDKALYFEFNNFKDDSGNKVKGCLCCLKEGEKGIRYITVSAFSEIILPNGAPAYIQEACSIYLGGDYKTLEELFSKECIHKEDNDLCTYESDSLLGSKAIRTILNAMLYVSNPNEEFKDEYNKFATVFSKNATQKKIYTEKTFTRIGYGEETEFLKMLVTKTTDVPPYWKNQPHGPQNSLRKYILCSGYERKNKAYFEKQAHNKS